MNQEVNFPISTSAIKLVKKCNASNDHGDPKKTPNTKGPQLYRWQQLRSAIEDWFVNQAPEELVIKKAENEQFHMFDKLQRKLVSDSFTTFRSLYPRSKSEINPEWPQKTVFKEINNEQYAISSHVQFEIMHKDKTEYITLKTGEIKETKLDKAIFTSEKYGNETYYTASIKEEDLIENETIDNHEEVIEEYFQIYEEFLNNPSKTTPNKNCTSVCSRPSKCGEFPVVENIELGKLDRGLTVSKTNLLKLEGCERRAAWKLLYGIPEDKENNFGEFGIKFHDAAGKMLVTTKDRNDPAEIERLKELIKDEDDELQEKIIERYKELLDRLKGYENLDLTLNEYPVGFTLVPNGTKVLSDYRLKEGKVATSFIGNADLLGRLDGSPIVIELKTGKKQEGDLTEAELYAFGIWKRFAEEEKKDVTVLHVYVNEAKDEPVTRRFGEEEFKTIEKKFLSYAEKIASWNPLDALSVDHSQGSCCDYCEFKQTCAEFR